MAIKLAKYLLWRARARAKRILNEIKEMRSDKKLDWEYISKPLQENPNDLGARAKTYRLGHPDIVWKHFGARARAAR